MTKNEMPQASESMGDELSALGENDLKYIEEFMKQLYNLEIDRKDKILSGVTVASSPIAILFAGVAFLVNGIFETNSDYLTKNLDICVVLYYIILLLIVFFVSAMVFHFHKLFSGENYNFLPDAGSILDHIIVLKKYCKKYGMKADGRLTDQVRSHFIQQYSECAAKNCAAKDVRLKFRQNIFRHTVFAIVCAAIGFVVVAVHRTQPHIWDISTLWRSSHGQSAQASQPRPAATATSGPAAASDKQPEAAAAPTSGH